MSHSDAAISINALTKFYGDKCAVNALSLEVPRGAVYGLLGPNGAGKTTTFSILASILRPSSGSARILGVEVGNLYTLRGRVAVLPQDAWFPAQVTIAAQLAHYARLMGMDDRAAHAEVIPRRDGIGLDTSGGHDGNSRQLSDESSLFLHSVSPSGSSSVHGRTRKKICTVGQ